jgi:hypothetical protein
MSQKTGLLIILALNILLNQVYSLKKVKRDDEINEDDTWKSYNFDGELGISKNNDDEIWSSPRFQDETMQKRNYNNDKDELLNFYKRKSYNQWRYDFMNKGNLDPSKTMVERQRCSSWGCSNLMSYLKGCRKYC